MPENHLNMFQCLLFLLLSVLASPESLSFKPPKLTGEERGSILTPSNLQCDACIAVSYQIEKALFLTERLYNTHSYVIGFEGATEDGYCKYDIYYTTGNVKTCIDHPNQGKTQRFRVPCDMKMVTGLFKHPRLHTHIGY